MLRNIIYIFSLSLHIYVCIFFKHAHVSEKKCSNKKHLFIRDNLFFMPWMSITPQDVHFGAFSMTWSFSTRCVALATAWSAAVPRPHPMSFYTKNRNSESIVTLPSTFWTNNSHHHPPKKGKSTCKPNLPIGLARCWLVEGAVTVLALFAEFILMHIVDFH